MAAGTGLTPEQRQLLLQALIQGGNEGMTNPAAALQNLLQAPGGQSAAQAIIGNLRNRLLPSSPSGAAGPSPAIQASRGLSGEEPTYAKTDAAGILADQPKPAEKKPDDIGDLAKKLADKAPEPPSKAAGGILAMGPSQGPAPVIPDVPDVTPANVAVNRTVSREAIGGRAYDLLIKTTAAEAGNQGNIGRQAVAHSILNRVQDGRYGDGIENVLMRGSQYEPLNEKNRARTLGLKPDDPRYQAAKADVDKVLSGEAPDPTGGATHFANPATVSGRGGAAMKSGGWLRRMVNDPNSKTIGAHVFGKADPGQGKGPGPIGQAQLADRANLANQMARPTTPPSAGQPGPIRTSGILGDQAQQAPTAPIPSFGGSGSRPVNALIVHHTGGNEQTADDVKSVYAQRGLKGAHLFMDRQGNVSQTLGFDQAGQHIRNGQGPGAGLNNGNTIGIEVSAKDDSDITPEQRASMQKLYPALQQQFPGIKVFGHGEINPHKQETEGATIVNELRNMAKPMDQRDATPPVADATGPTTPDPNTTDTTDNPLTLNVTPSGTDTSSDTDLGPVTAADQGDLGGDVGGLLGGLGGLMGGGEGGGEDSGPSQLQEWDQQDAKEPDKPLIPEEDKQPGGILAGDNSLLRDESQDRVDLSRMFSPEGMGGTGLFGRDQGPDTSGFKAPVGLPTAGLSGTSPSPAAGILGAPETGIASITPPQLRSIAPSAPIPPSRPPDLGIGIDAPTLAPPDVPLPPPRPAGIGGMGVELPPPRPQGLLTDALPPPRPVGIGGEVPLPPRRPSDLGTGLLGNPPNTDPGLIQVPDVPTPVIPPLPPIGTPNTPGMPGPGMGGANPPWQDPPKPAQQGLLGTPSTDDLFAKFSKGAGSLSGLLGQAAEGTGSGGQRKRPSGSTASPPLVPQTPLLTGGLLSNARQGIDLNRFFGLLSGRIG
jgi:hypothetical protein